MPRVDHTANASPNRIGSCLWFEDRAVEAAEFYVSLFPGSRILEVSTVGAGPAKGNAFVVFELSGRSFQGIDGGPMFKFTPAISFVVNCDGQDEIDHYWAALSAGARRVTAAGSTTASGCRGRWSRRTWAS